ncbi:MAG: AMP-binding protein [Planctomycetota bacterium]
MPSPPATPDRDTPSPPELPPELPPESPPESPPELPPESASQSASEPASGSTPDGTAAFGFPEVDLVARFEAMVDQGPDRLALDSAGARFTYAQLNAKANRVAHALLAAVPRARQPVAQPEDTPRVALFVDQGIDLAAAVLGTLKAGCAYVPLDPTYPDHKNAHMLADARPAAVVTYHASSERADTLYETRLPKVLIESLPDTGPADNPGLDLEPHRLAYVLYTSGSTGKPKGVMQSHRSVLHNCAVHADAFAITPDDRQTLLYPCSVYGGVRDTYNALLNGASLHHYPVREAGYDGLKTWLAEHRISLYCSVASVFRHFARGIDEADGPPDKERYADLRIIKLGGEAPLPTDVELYRRHFPDHCELSCGLGSTETGMSCRFPVMKDTPLDGPAIPLGRPVHGMEVLLVDEHRQPLAPAPDATGEMAIRSRYLTDGYLGRDDLNHTVFAADPEDPALRTFYTGDLAQQNADGDFVHRGRKDHQVKVRGNRVELQEVEAALEAHPHVRDALVLAKTDPGGSVRLVAYLVVNPGQELTAHLLRDHLKNLVARFAIPNLYLQLPEIPLTPNGKRNRLALPEPDAAGVTHLPAGLDSVAPANERERTLADIFARVLKTTEKPGVTLSFFDLGGDSLQAVSLILGIEKDLGVRLELATLISHPTVRQLAELLGGDTSSLDAAAHAPVVGFHPLSPSRTKPPLFCLSGRGGSVICYHELARRLPDDQPVYGIQFPGVNAHETILDEVAPLAAELIRRMQTVQPPDHGPYRLLGYSFGAVVAYDMARQLHDAGQTVDYLGILDCQAPQTKTSLPRAQRLRIQLRDLARMNWPDRTRWLKSRLAGQKIDIAEYQIEVDTQGMPEAMLDRLRGLSDASRRAYKAYHPVPQIHTPLTLLRCEERHEWMHFFEDQPDRGWSRYAPLAATFSIPGRHLEVFHRQHAPRLAQQVTASLESIPASRP